MGYFYDNNIRKVPGPVYVYDYILTIPAIPGEIVFTTSGNVNTSSSVNPLLSGDDKSAIRSALNSVRVGRYILFSPEDTNDENIQSYAGTIWQKVVEANKVKFTIVADRYTNPIHGVTGPEMSKIWNQVECIESETIKSAWGNL